MIHLIFLSFLYVKLAAQERLANDQLLDANVFQIVEDNT